MTPDQQTLVQRIIDETDDMTVATIRDDGYPQATTVSFINDGPKIYFMTAKQAQKARNIARCDKVSITIDRPYKDWKDIKSLSIGGRARAVTDEDETARVMTRLQEKFPEAVDYSVPEDFEPALFRIDPEVISILDYSQGFGESTLVTP